MEPAPVNPIDQILMRDARDFEETGFMPVSNSDESLLALSEIQGLIGKLDRREDLQILEKYAGAINRKLLQQKGILSQIRSGLRIMAGKYQEPDEKATQIFLDIERTVFGKESSDEEYEGLNRPHIFTQIEAFVNNYIANSDETFAEKEEIKDLIHHLKGHEKGLTLHNFASGLKVLFADHARNDDLEALFQSLFPKKT